MEGHVTPVALLRVKHLLASLDGALESERVSLFELWKHIGVGDGTLPIEILLPVFIQPRAKVVLDKNRCAQFANFTTLKKTAILPKVLTQKL